MVLGTGAYQRPHRPAGAATLPADLLQIDVQTYRNPAALPPGRVLVVGSGQSGCQVAEDLHQAGREVFLACGHRRCPGGSATRDVRWWAVETGFYDAPRSSLPHPALRLAGNVQATGNGGGHDRHYRTLRRMGVTLLGHFVAAPGRRARFARDLAERVAWGDQRAAQLMESARELAAARSWAPPEIAEPPPFDGGAPAELDLRGFGAVVFASGFRPDYDSWVRFPGAFDEFGIPIQHDGASMLVPRLTSSGSISCVSASPRC